MAILEERFGNDGYAVWFKLLERVGSSEGHAWNSTEELEWDYFCSYVHLEPDKCREVVDLLAKLGAIDADLWTKDSVAWSDHFIEGVTPVYDKRDSSLPGKPGFLHGNNGKGKIIPENEVNDTGNPQRRVEKSKGEKSIAKKEVSPFFESTKQAFLAARPEGFGNYAKECPHINGIIKLAKSRGDPELIIPGMLNMLVELKESGNDFWEGQPILPSTLVSLWERVWEQARKKKKQEVPDGPGIYDIT